MGTQKYLKTLKFGNAQKSNQMPLSSPSVMSSLVTVTKVKTLQKMKNITQTATSCQHILLPTTFLYNSEAFFAHCAFIQFHSIARKGHTYPNPNMPTTQTHVLAYPFPSSGHVIPLLDLAKRLVSRGVHVTVLVTPSTQLLVPTNYSPLLQTLLLPAPQFPNPNQNRLVAMVTFMRHQHYPILLEWARAHPLPPSAILSDFFLGWTHNLASDLHVPRMIFSPSGAFGLSISFSLWRDLPQNDNPEDPNSVVSFPNLPNSPVYPWWQISHHFKENKRGGPEWEFHRENMLLNLDAWGVVFNTFTELERVYLDHVKKELGHGRVWAVGPVLPLEDGSTGPEVDRGGSITVSCHDLMNWLDSQPNGSVVYVCFGSRTFLTSAQMDVLTRALELSGVHFILSVRGPDERHVALDQGAIPSEFVDRVRGRGFIIEGWAPQLVILSHRAVGAFLTHCGWNSVLEGLASGVVMLTWPMGADQFTNSKLLVDQLGVAVRAAEGTEKVPEPTELAKRIEESLGRTKERVRAEELRDAALGAVKKDGSSHKQLDALVKQLNELKNEQVAI
ncbi:flavonol 3-O-glucosyltransferase UGT89B1-like [Gastrolobium bilobum]|uniref:flavonol 3-O-glucosyltransferase UGT89B1-like n=1 Tax=Gastrolobium bilobum TaxID=150636 RepID=UPI002AB30439|nr:flavonol 3-O-glucosyltransferase UGT89B1-like [Gastrolobium bilobum]